MHGCVLKDELLVYGDGHLEGGGGTLQVVRSTAQAESHQLVPSHSEKKAYRASH